MAILIQCSQHDVNISYKVVDKAMYDQLSQELRNKQLTKEKIIRETDPEELFCLFHTFIMHFNEIFSPDVIKVTDKQIGDTVERMKKAYS